MTATTDLETALLDAHYAGDPAARFAWLGWCEDNGVRLTEVGITGVWRGTLAEWLEVGPGLVQRVALERVELVDRVPELSTARKYSWFINRRIKRLIEIEFSDPDDLPLEWFPEYLEDFIYLTAYPTRQDAIDDASRRAIRWAREQGQREEVSRG